MQPELKTFEQFLEEQPEPHFNAVDRAKERAVWLTKMRRDYTRQWVDIILKK